MFCYAVCVGPSGRYESLLKPSLEALELAPVLERRGERSLIAAYNSLADEVSSWDGLEGLVMVHDDVEIREKRIEEILRACFEEGDVGLVGVIGGRQVRHMSWWTADERLGQQIDAQHRVQYTEGVQDVDCLDGLFLAFSPWVVRNVRFSTEGYPGFHGYDAEMSAAVKAAGKRVVVAPIDYFHHSKPDSTKSRAYQLACYNYMLRWTPGNPGQRAVWHAKRSILKLMAR